MARRGALLLGLLTALLVAACASDEPPPPCPQVVPIREAARVVDFLGSGQDLTDVTYEAAMSSVSLTCEYDDDAVEGELTVTMIATEGPANESRNARLGYFVAIANEDQQILTKETFEVEVVFHGTLTRLSVTEQLSPRIPLRPGESGANYLIFVGFLLTPSQLEYNKKAL